MQIMEWLWCACRDRQVVRLLFLSFVAQVCSMHGEIDSCSDFCFPLKLVVQVCAVGTAGIQGVPPARVDVDGSPQIHLHIPHLPGAPQSPLFSPSLNFEHLPLITRPCTSGFKAHLNDLPARRSLCFSRSCFLLGGIFSPFHLRH
jgi:hypothetical protein